MACGIQADCKRTNRTRGCCFALGPACSCRLYILSWFSHDGIPASVADRHAVTVSSNQTNMLITIRGMCSGARRGCPRRDDDKTLTQQAPGADVETVVDSDTDCTTTYEGRTTILCRGE